MKSRNRKKSASGNTLVYTTDSNRTCPGCLRKLVDCICKTPHATTAEPGKGVRLHRETKARKGKGVTLIKGLSLEAGEMAALAKALKSACGVGGTVKAGVVEIQTADRERIQTLLEQQGIPSKLAGG